MSEEKKKAEAVRRASTLQRGEEGSPIESAIEIVKEQVAAEAELYAKRGYGGYIKTEHIKAIRATRDEAVEKVEKLRADWNS
jgi:hypothetical protein